MNEEAVKSRVVGLLMLCGGLVLTYCNYSMRVNQGRYYLQLALLGPLFIGLSIDLLVEAPELPVVKPSIFGWICILGGTGFGLWNAIF